CARARPGGRRGSARRLAPASRSWLSPVFELGRGPGARASAAGLASQRGSARGRARRNPGGASSTPGRPHGPRSPHPPPAVRLRTGGLRNTRSQVLACPIVHGRRPLAAAAGAGKRGAPRNRSCPAGPGAQIIRGSPRRPQNPPGGERMARPPLPPLQRQLARVGRRLLLQTLLDALAWCWAGALGLSALWFLA